MKFWYSATKRKEAVEVNQNSTGITSGTPKTLFPILNKHSKIIQREKQKYVRYGVCTTACN